MLGIDWRAAKVTWTVFLFVLVLFLVYVTREAILLFVAAFVLAYILSPLLRFVIRVTPPHVSRTVALAVVFVAVLLVVGLVGAWLLGQMVSEVNSLAERLPAMIEKHKDLSAVPLPSWLEPVRARVVELIRGQLDTGAERIVPILQKAVGGIVGLAGGLMFLIIVPILTFLFMKDAEELQETLVGFIPPHKRRLARDVVLDIHIMLAQYIRALVTLSVLTSVVYLLFFSAIGLPYAVLVSVLAAPLEFIPFFGPLIGTVLILAIAIFTGFPHIWWILIFFAAYRAFQDYVVQPYLMSSGIALHPLLVLFGALDGESLGGLWGMFLSVPVLAILRIMFVRLLRVRDSRLEQPQV
jgi:predicted PurR-regulated permease PerM